MIISLSLSLSLSLSGREDTHPAIGTAKLDRVSIESSAEEKEWLTLENEARLRMFRENGILHN